MHRDLKPGNVLLHEGRWKIADFGIARFVEDATSVNTVRDFLSAPYAAPEQWRGEHATHSTDVYALSCVAHELVTGNPPFPGPTTPDYQRQHLTETAPLLTAVDPRMQAILSAGLRKPQGGRPSVERVITVLRDVCSSPGPIAPTFGALQGANAVEAERLSEAAAKNERERQKAAERLAIVEASETVFRDILKRLEQVLQENASEARVHGSGENLNISMGQAELDIILQGAAPPDISLGNGSWTIAAISLIRVSQRIPEWSHGATLWYMRPRHGQDFRWYEVAYKRNAIVRGPIVGPFPIQDVGYDIYGQASLAAGPGMHTIQVDFGPVPIDDENEQSFFQRWLERLVQAYHGRLRPF